jgi:hypothetical protein
MEQTKIEIIESSLPKDNHESISKNILSWIFRNDEQGRLNALPDYRVILMNNSCNALEFLKTIQGWENVVDLEYINLTMNGMSDEKRDYIQKLKNIDKKHYNIMYFYIRLPPMKVCFFGIIGKKNIILDETISEQKECNANVEKVKSGMLELEKKNAVFLSDMEKSLQTTEENFAKSMEEKLSKFSESVENAMEERKKEQDEYIENNNSKIMQNFRELIIKFEENEESSNNKIDALNQNFKQSQIKIESEFNEYVKTLQFAFDSSVDKMRDEYLQDFKNTKTEVSTKISAIEKVVEAHNSNICEKVDSIDTYMKHRDSEYMAQFKTTNANLQEKLNAECTSINNKINQFVESLKSDVESTNNKLVTEINKNKEHIENQNKSTNEHVQHTHEIINNKLVSLKKELEEKIRENQDKSSQENDESVQKIENVNETLINLIQNNHRSVVSIIEEFKKSTDEKLESIKTKFNNEIVNINQSLDDVVDTLFPDGVRRL